MSLLQKHVPRDFSLSRTLTGLVLTTCIERRLSNQNPLQCLDFSIDESESSKWKNKHGSSIVILNDILNRNELEGEKEEITKTKFGSNYVVIEKSDFNFIYVECTTEGSSYFDCVFRKISRNGLFVLSTSDDPALYGRPAEPALRCYSGVIVRTCYAQEMAVRLILASMARSAARFAKSIEVLLAVVIKNSITIVVQVQKGANSAVKCLKTVKSLVHCTICEERAFLPENFGFIIDDVKKYLTCGCAEKSEGQTVASLGPLWSGPIGTPSILVSLLPLAKHSLQTYTFLQDLITELRCKQSSENEAKKTVSSQENTFDGKCQTPCSTLTNKLKRKFEDNSVSSESKVEKVKCTDSDPAPVFYYSIHKHKPVNTTHLVKVDRIIEMLHRKGFRASRTHFNRKAVKTNCTLKELQIVISQIV